MNLKNHALGRASPLAIISSITTTSSSLSSLTSALGSLSIHSHSKARRHSEPYLHDDILSTGNIHGQSDACLGLGRVGQDNKLLIFVLLSHTFLHCYSLSCHKFSKHYIGYALLGLIFLSAKGRQFTDLIYLFRSTASSYDTRSIRRHSSHQERSRTGYQRYGDSFP